MKKIYFLFLCLCSKFIAFAQRGFRPELDLQEPYDPDEYAPTTFDPRGFIFLFVIISVIIIIWVVNSQKKNRKYKAKENIYAFYSMDDYYEFHSSINYVPNFKLIEKGTICTIFKKNDDGVCNAHFEGYGDYVCEFDELTRVD